LGFTDRRLRRREKGRAHGQVLHRRQNGETIPVDAPIIVRYVEQGGEAMNEERESDIAEKKEPKALSADAVERWDWEFYQVPPRPLRRWKVRGRIVWKGKAEPLPT
jgi:hypothetical protein